LKKLFVYHIFNMALLRCCFGRRHDDVQNNVPISSNMTEKLTRRRKALMLTDKNTHEALPIIRGVLSTLECNSEQEDIQRGEARMVYKSKGWHTRLSDSYPVVENGLSNRDGRSYAWQVFMLNRWLPYQKSIAQKLEELFRSSPWSDEQVLKHKYKRNWWRIDSLMPGLTFSYKHYEICPMFMLQRNMNTGKERSIRRVLIKREFLPQVVAKFPPRRVQESYQPSYKKRSRGPSSSSAIYLPRRIKKNLRRADPKVVLKRTIIQDGRQDDEQGIKVYDRHYFDVESSSSPDSCWSKESTDKDDDLTHSHYDDIWNWLCSLHLEQYFDVFMERSVSMKELAQADLRQLIKWFALPEKQSKEIFNALKALRSSFTKQSTDSNCNTNSRGKKSDCSMTNPQHQIVQTNFSSKKHLYTQESSEEFFSARGKLSRTVTPGQYNTEISLESVKEGSPRKSHILRDADWFDTTTSEQQSITTPEYERPEGYTEVWSPSFGDCNTTPKKSNTFSSTEEESERYLHFKSGQNTKNVLEDRESCTVSPTEVRRWLTATQKNGQIYSDFPEKKNTSQRKPVTEDREGEGISISIDKGYLTLPTPDVEGVPMKTTWDCSLSSSTEKSTNSSENSSKTILYMHQDWPCNYALENIVNMKEDSLKEESCSTSSGEENRQKDIRVACYKTQVLKKDWAYPQARYKLKGFQGYQPG